MKIWYGRQDKELDYFRPIFAFNDDEMYLLVPQIEKDSFAVVGYNWFDIEIGEYNSCVCFETAKAAVIEYSLQYKIVNGSVKAMGPFPEDEDE